MKRVLVVYFSQTGQLRCVAESFCKPLEQAPEVALSWQALSPIKPYPFPWPFFEFFDQFPECVHLKPPELSPINCGEDEFDLVVLAYTVWFLSPAPPVTAFLKSEHARKILQGRPVVTLVACRNMWLGADREVRRLLAGIGARHMDHVVFTDRGPALSTFITTPRWMLTGRRDSLWGMPAAGVAQADIDGATRFGHALREALAQDLEQGNAPMLQGLGAVKVDQRLIASEKIGRRSFEIWGHLVMASGSPGSRLRRCVLAIYAVFLVSMILTVVPVTMSIRALLKPFTRKKMARITRELEKPSGSGRERMAAFSDSAKV